MKLEYELSKLALKDINSIWNYTAEQWSIAQADNYFNQIFEAIELICSNPELGKSFKEVKKNHRVKIVKFHMIIYKIEKGILFIDRILHQRMDIDSELEK